jgi:NADH-quinone oxidoreductase subunit L
MKWLDFGRFSAEIGVLLDPLSVMMLTVVGVVALMVAVYSFGYMKGERGFGRYYALLGLFVFSMLGLVVSTNIFQMYVFWELVGASSYLLIGFYYTKPAAVAASKKAFIVTRFADLFFLVGILILSFGAGTFDFAALTADNAALVTGSMSGGAATWAAALIFVGAAGKSAMFPLHIWLPDAMEGPTPVSALIHAATMVVAGVYLIARMFPVYYFAAPDVLTTITYVGAFTALFAALIATQQSDIKRVLAFSTISQIAYMMVALGVSGYWGAAGEGYSAGLFHLFTHAFFKALLFLGAGSVIHAVHSNEMSRMGGLRRFMPITHITFLVACLSIAGIPPFSGFFSKDGILAAAWHHDKLVFGVMLAVAGLTAYYMFRLYFRIFWGSRKVYEHPPHEAPAVMWVPLVVLALLTCVTGFVPFAEYISPDGEPFAMHINWIIAASGVAVAALGIAVAAKKYMHNDGEKVWRAARERFYIDAAWQFFAHRVVFNCVSRPVAWFDRKVVDGAMNALGRGTLKAAEAIKTAESGRVQGYAMVFVAAVLIITLLTLVL